MNVNPTFFVIMVELLVVESLALVAITALYIRRKFQYKNMIEHIVEAAQASESARLELLEKTLKDVFNEDSEDANRKAKELARAESRFCRRLISAFVSHKHDVLGRLDKMTDELLSPYRSLISETAEEKVRTKQQLSKRVKTLKHTVETLREEKEKITRQLAETEEELESITAEYVSAFKKEELLKQTQEAAQATSSGETSVTAETREDESPEKEETGIVVTDEIEAAGEGETAPAADGGTTRTEATDDVLPAGAEAGDKEDDEEEDLLKLEELDTSEDKSGSDSATTTEQDTVAEAADDLDDGPTATAAPSASDEAQDTGTATADDEDQSGAGGNAPDNGALLEDVDISAAPLLDEVAKENTVKIKSATG